MPMTMFVGIAAGASLLIGALRGRRPARQAALHQRRDRDAAARARVRRDRGRRVRARGRAQAVHRARRPVLDVDHARRGRASCARPARPPTIRIRCATRRAIRPQQLAHGAKVFRALCDACHTMQRRERARPPRRATWTDDQLRLNIAKLQHTKGFMPPFAGNAEDVEALVQLLRWERDGAPGGVAARRRAIRRTLAQIATLARRGRHARPSDGRSRNDVAVRSRDAHGHVARALRRDVRAARRVHRLRLAGTGVRARAGAPRATDDPIAEHVRDRLPFMLGCGDHRRRRAAAVPPAPPPAALLHGEPAARSALGGGRARADRRVLRAVPREGSRSAGAASSRSRVALGASRSSRGRGPSCTS